jgi:molybdopterin synthase catalytic subunit
MTALAPVLLHAIGQARGIELKHTHPTTPSDSSREGRAGGDVAHVLITESPLDLNRVVTAVGAAEAGGLGIFAGAVRDHDDGRGVTALAYEAHPSAASVLREVCERAAARPGVTAVAAEHRVGQLLVGDLAVVVAVSAPHRAEALEACRWLIDTLKHEVPIWKHQTYADGSTDWVGAC